MNEAYLEKIIWKKALCCGSVFSEAHIEGILIEVLSPLLGQNVKNWWPRNTDEEVEEIRKNTTSISAMSSNRPEPVKVQDKESSG